MLSYKNTSRLAGWLVFAISMFVYFLSAERSGSLWDCGEFILGAYKLQVVHPPGAPLFLIVGRMFAWVGDLFSDNPEHIAFAVNLMSGMCSAFAATFICWATIALGKLTLVGRADEPSLTQDIALAMTGITAGLATAFSSSVWFSAVEGEVYAMSTFFTCMTLWATIKWYSMPDNEKSDRWLVFAIYSTGLSLGVHLLSLLTFPALALFYYFKRYNKPTIFGAFAAMGIGAGLIFVLQKFIIVGIPKLWSWMELLMVNGLGLPFNTGIIPTLFILLAVAYFGLKFIQSKGWPLVQNLFTGILLVAISFTTFGVVVLRAHANPPINMNQPDDAFRLIPYLNREQYGERPILNGPHFNALPVNYETEDRYGKGTDQYEIMEKKYTPIFRPQDKMFFPRMSHSDDMRKLLYQQFYMKRNGNPTLGENISFFFQYQVMWMYWRYFMWNFAGRQNGDQGYEPWVVKSGNWYTGIKFLDENRLYNEDKLPDTIKNNQARNRYFMIPFLLGLIGLFYQAKHRPDNFLTLFILFLITGLGIIVYSNQPPREPRERDYVLVGSFITYCMWIGLSVLAIFDLLKKYLAKQQMVAAIVAGMVVLIAPGIMLAENFDDHTRRNLKGARDYASNFLNSLEPNAIIFTYGDNDTYPLWYAQEVEGIRRDVRVINLSLIAVDWYINGQRRKINDSPPVKLTMSEQAYRGDARNQISFGNSTTPVNAVDALKFAGEDHQGPYGPGVFPSQILSIPVDVNKALANGWIYQQDSAKITNRLEINWSGRRYVTKDDVAIIDIIASNINDRPIYFAMTSQLDKLNGLEKYTSVEGVAARLVPLITEPIRALSIQGIGRIDTKRAFDNMMNKFRWGNFDKHKMYVDNSFAPTLQTLRYQIFRTIQALQNEGKLQEAADLAQKYFEGFPFENFPYDPADMNAVTGQNFTLEMINALIKNNRLDEAKNHLRLLAKETAQFAEFYNSLSTNELASFQTTNGYSEKDILSTYTIPQVLRVSKTLNDAAFDAEINGLLGKYYTAQVPN